MKQLITRFLLLMVGIFVMHLPASAMDLYLIGGGNSMDSKSPYGWNLPGAKVSGDSEIYFWVQGEFKLSKNSASDWGNFNSGSVKLENGKVSYPGTDTGNMSFNGGCSFVKISLSYGNDTYTVQDTPFPGHEGAFGGSTSYKYWFHGWKSNSSYLNRQFENGSFTMKGSDFKGYNFGIQAQDASTTSYGDDAKKAWYETTSSQKVNKYGKTEFTLVTEGTSGAANFSPTDELESDKDYTFTLTFDSNNVPVKLTVTGPEQGGGGSTTDNHDYYLHIFKGNEIKDLKFVNNSLTINCSEYKGYSFGVGVWDFGGNEQKKWYATNSSNKNVGNSGTTTFSLSDTNIGNMNLPSLDNGTFVFNLSLNSDKMPSSLSVTVNGGVTPPGPGEDYPSQGTYMYASWLDQPYGQVGTFSTEANAVSGSFTLPAATSERKIYYVVYRDGTRWGHNGGNMEQKITDISYKNAVKLESVQSTENDCFYVTIPANREVTFNFQSNFNCNDNLNGYTEHGVPAVWLSDMKVVTVDASRANKVYLINKLLNDNHESPAWEMVKQTNGTYYLAPFAMRELKKGDFTSGNDDDFKKLQIAVYDENGYRYEKEVQYSGFDKTYNRDSNLQPGWRYSASLDAAQAKVTFTEEEVEGRSVLPYIGVLGQNFRQAKEYNTRHSYSEDGRMLMGKTSCGWQEAYIEYGADGQPVLESDGTAIYNTVWPPRNNILMTSHISDDIDDLNVSTNELTMKRDSRGVMTGAEWTSTLKAENNTEYNYVGFELDADKKYARYYVENVWMLGSYKIWTGWGGQKANWGAYWNSHTYLGAGAGDSNDDNHVVNIHEAYKIRGRGANFMTGNDGKNREYYRTMELFLPVTDDNETDYSYKGENGPRLYLTEADGGAVIDAVARDNKYVGYVPTLANMPNGYRLKDYKITRYRYVANDDKKNYKPVDRQNQEVNESDAIVKSQSWDDNTIDTNAKFNALFTKDSEIFSSKYVNDGEYNVGRYIFKLNVTFVDSQAGDKTRTAEVWSPYVEIFDVEGNINISADQLIELPSDFEGEYTHVTYDPAYTGAKLVKVVGDKVTAIANADNTGNKIQKVYEQTGAWTNTALITVSDPAGFAGTTNSFTVSKGSAETYVSYDLLNNAYKLNGTGSNYVVDNNALNLLKTGYEAAFDGTLSSGGGSATPHYNASVTYTPTFMLPALKNAELTFGDDVNAADMTATHEHVKYKVENSNDWTHQQTVNAHHNKFGVKVPVQMPIISAATAGLKKAVYDALSVKLKLDSEADFEMTPEVNATDYALNYTYQSPYDWMEHDGATWKAKGHSWNLGNSSYKATTDIAGVFPTLDASYETSATLAPAFKAPEFDHTGSQNDLIWFGSKVDDAEDGNGFDIEIWIKQINVKPQEGNKLADGVNVNAGDDDALVLLITTSDESKKDRIVSKVVKVSDLADPEKKHIIIKYHSDATNYGELYWDLQDWFNNKVQIEAAYAYYFDSEGADGTSKFSGFTGTFPYIRYDKKPANGSSKTAPSQSDSSTTLADGDNSFLLAPAYTVLMAEGDGIMTGVDDIIDAAGNVTVGEGFIDLNGNNGMVFSADGCMVYSGAARCEVEKGVYVVTVNGKSTKVIVK